MTTSTNVRCDRELMLPRHTAACRSLNRSSTITPAAAVVEILRSRSPSDQSGPPWTDSVVRRTEDASTVSRWICSFPVDGDPPPRQPLTPTGSDGLDRKCRRRRSTASSQSSQDLYAQSVSTIKSAADSVAARRHAQTSQDYDDDITDDQVTSCVTSSSPPTVKTSEQQ